MKSPETTGIPTPTDRPRRGYRRSDGLIYWSSVRGTPYWVNEARFNQLREKARKSQTKRNLRNPSGRSEGRKRHYFRYRDRLNQNRQRLAKKAYRDDALSRAKKQMRNILWNGLNATTPKGRLKAEALLACSIGFFRAHIAAQFEPGMSWGDRRSWEIDHLVPLDTAKDVATAAALFHFSNLRPISPTENRRKWVRLAA